MTKHDDDAADRSEQRLVKPRPLIEILRLYRDWLAEADRQVAVLTWENRHLGEQLARARELLRRREQSGN